MSREIKFRVWDSVNAEMTTPNETLDILITMDNKVFALMKEDNCSLGEIDRENTIIMQFTGLLDLNGKEIYEGDILKCGNYPNQKPQYIVKFGEFEDTPDHYYVLEQIGWYIEDIGYQDEFNNSLAFIVNDLDGVVCGNIYENKELLEEVE